ncbi:6-phospho-beta-glucosidase [Clostridium diolis]|uniref:glycoside hydrolase family 1 protein n=1 Tax=Clostridium diolis TaxID=223919 RepID=UPI000B3F7456|nr:glycoside hydrolase family 1 protein [Clostridium diolis]OVE65025.1 6-phospho-beta-glucosidase [Clostridium diolis]
MKNKDFLWGNSVSSMQTEGAWNEEGKGLSVYDMRKMPENLSDWKVGIDEYHRYEEDFDLMKELGMNCYRFSISWSRVNPTGDGEFNEAGIQYYERFINALISRGIEPMICLYHFDMPFNLAEKYNGFLSKHVVDAFIRYSIEMVKRFEKKVKWWISFNEQNHYFDSKSFRLSGYLNGEKTLEELYQIYHNVMYSHACVANYIHENTECKIGGMVAYSDTYPHTCHPKDILISRKWDEFVNYNTLDAFTSKGYSKEVMNYIKTKNLKVDMTEEELKEIQKVTSDFLSLSYYRTNTFDHTLLPENEEVAPNYYLDYCLKKNPYLVETEWGWQIDPDGYRDVLNKVYQRYRLPVFSIENGIGVIEKWDGENMIEDDYRIDFHEKHIQAMKKAIDEDGVEIIGYLGWGMIDILSSQGDMDKRYGVVYVNRDNKNMLDLKRVKKRSFDWLKQVIHTNGASIGANVNQRGGK